MDKTRQVAYVVVAAALCCAFACGGATSTTTSNQRGTTSSASKSDIKRGAPDPEPVSEEGKRWGGWRWRGKRDTCFFVYKNRCYTEKRKACAVAGCGKGKCAYRGGGPAEIYCKK